MCICKTVLACSWFSRFRGHQASLAAPLDGFRVCVVRQFPASVPDYGFILLLEPVTYCNIESADFNSCFLCYCNITDCCVMASPSRQIATEHPVPSQEWIGEITLPPPHTPKFSETVHLAAAPF